MRNIGGIMSQTKLGETDAFVPTSKAVLGFLKSVVHMTEGNVYYVAKNGNNTTGKSWQNAFTTIAAAITASNATVTWAGNEEDNYILIAPGEYAEALTALPWYCHMIGLGMPTLADSACSVKIHPAAGAAMLNSTVIGLHLYNLSLQAVGAVDILNFGTCNDTLIENCLFSAKDGNVVNMISTDNSDGLTIIGCKFRPKGGIGVGATVGILFQGGSDKFWHNGIIKDCIIGGLDPTGTGIKIESDCTASCSVIQNNIVYLSGAGTGIDDDSDLAIVQDNTVYHIGGTPYDINAALASQNIANDNGTVTDVPNMA